MREGSFFFFMHWKYILCSFLSSCVFCFWCSFWHSFLMLTTTLCLWAQREIMSLLLKTILKYSLWFIYTRHFLLQRSHEMFDVVSKGRFQSWNVDFILHSSKFFLKCIMTPGPDTVLIIWMMWNKWKRFIYFILFDRAKVLFSLSSLKATSSFLTLLSRPVLLAPRVVCVVVIIALSAAVLLLVNKLKTNRTSDNMNLEVTFCKWLCLSLVLPKV